MKQWLFLIILFASFGLFSQSEPSWISQFPYSPDFYTGIGSSNTGNRSDDYNLALERARLNLAAEISTSITAETTLETRDSTRSGSEEIFTEKMNQVVEQNLKELEIVDSWYSRSQGYWVYIRLSKATWAAIRERETAQITERVESLINSDYFGTSITTSDKLNRLGTSAAILQESPYGDIVNGELGGLYKGNIRDFVISEIYALSTGVTIKSEKDQIQPDREGKIALVVNCQSSEYYTGRLPLSIITSERVLKEVLTDIRGTAIISLDKNQFPQSQNNVTIQIDPLKLGFPAEGEYIRQFISDAADIQVEISAESVYLSIESNRNTKSYHHQLSTLFSHGNRGFELSDSAENSLYTLDFSLVFSDFPQVLENAPLIAGLEGHLKLQKGTRVLYEYSTPAFKDGGLTYEQAYERTFREMITFLGRESDYLDSIEQAIKE